MRWKGRRQSRNVEDRRGRQFPGGRGGGVSCLGLLVVIGIAWLTGANPQQLLGLLVIFKCLEIEAVALIRG